MNNSDWDDLVLLDWEWSGLSNPGIDLAVFFYNLPIEFLLKHEDEWLLSYYKALIRNRPDIEQSYSIEQLKSDYLGYGTSHDLIRLLGFAKWNIELNNRELGQFYLDTMSD